MAPSVQTRRWRLPSSVRRPSSPIGCSPSQSYDDTRAIRWHPSTRHADAWSPGAPGPVALPSPPGCSPHQRRCCRLYRPTAAPRRAVQTHPPSPPRARGVRRSGQVVHPCGQYLNAHGRAIRTADQMHTPSKELLPFGGAAPVRCATGRLPTAPGARPAANKRRRGEAIDDEHVARGDAPPTFAGIQTIQSAI
jgi:hypothetical protein